MAECNAEQLVTEILGMIGAPGQVQRWAEARLDGSVPAAIVQEACVGVTKNLLQADPPRTGEWEHFLVTLATHSQRSKKREGTELCVAVIRGLLQLLDAGELDAFDDQKVVTLANALTLTLSAQRPLRQDIEEAISRICEKWPGLMPQIGQQCQYIWQRKGQVSGAPGLFLWDRRHHQWRLATDFRQHGDA